MCKTSFTSKRARSRFVKMIKYDTDFCPIYSDEGVNPLYYYVKVCPHCGFSFSEDFLPFFAPGSQELIKEKVCNNWVSQDFGGERTVQSAIQTLKLAVYCGTLKREKHINLSGLYMRLAWLNREIGNEVQELRFINLALDEYLSSYTEDDYKGTQVSEVRMLYLIAELSRRTNKIDQATRYFSRVIEKQKSTTEANIIEMAKERWHEIREMQKESNH